MEKDLDDQQLAAELQQRLGLSPEEAREIEEIYRGREMVVKQPEEDLAVKVLKNKELGELTKEENTDVRNKLSKMNIAEKLKVAMLGNKSCRAVLINEPNRMISEMVLRNPRLTINEVEEFSKNPNLGENIIRMIGRSREWMKEYNVKKNVVSNSKTPIDIALTWLKYINKNDLRMLGKSKNISQVVANAARKKLSEMEH